MGLLDRRVVMAEATVTGVRIKVGKVPDKDCSMVMSYEKKAPITKKFDEWAEAARQAGTIAHRACLDAVEVVFHTSTGDRTFEVDTPNTDKGERLAPALVVVERILERRCYEVQYISKGIWILHRPDPAGSYAIRGYFSAEELIILAAERPEVIDGAIVSSSSQHVSSMRPYMTLSRGDNMATKKAGKAAETKKESLTIKNGGKEFAVSPTQAEVFEDIKKRSGTGKPLGSDEERLTDPQSIAAMKLNVMGAVQRHKFGTRFHYFANEADMAKAVKAYEKEAEEAAAIKAASKRPAKDKEEGKPAKKSSAKKGVLKKPSEK